MFAGAPAHELPDLPAGAGATHHGSRGAPDVQRTPPCLVCVAGDATLRHLADAVPWPADAGPVCPVATVEEAAATVARRAVSGVVIACAGGHWPDFDVVARLCAARAGVPVVVVPPEGVPLVVSAGVASATVRRVVDVLARCAAVARGDAGDTPPRTMRAQGASPADAVDELVGRSRPLAELRARIRDYAARDVTTLVVGETGTGKELVARALHRRSARRTGPFVAVNCAAIPESLLESELFGTARGAYTGAERDRAGLLQSAAGGTLFLDEIGEMPLALQPKLLRVLETGWFRPLGQVREVRADVRVVAATNRELKALVDAGAFRADLYYRLAVLTLRVPPLRARLVDVPLLVEAFLRRHAGDSVVAVAPGAMDALLAWHWPGNVRELQHVVERSLVLTRGGRIERFDVDDAGRTHGPEALDAESLVEALRRHRGRLVRVAEEFDVAVKTVQRRMGRLGLSFRDFRRLPA